MDFLVLKSLSCYTCRMAINVHSFNFSGRAVIFSACMAFWIFFGNAASSFGIERNIQFSIDAGAGSWKAAGLKNLPKKSTLRISASSREEFAVIILNQTSYALLPKIVDPLFQDTISKELTFSIAIPDTDDYYLVLDNRQGTRDVSVHFDIRASYNEPFIDNAAEEPEENDIGLFRKQLNTLPKELEKLFIFTPFPMFAKSCGSVNITASTEGVTLCLEFLQDLTAEFGRNEKGKDVLLFALLHEVGHILLYQWDYPFYDNEEIADEFAAIILIMLKKQESISATAEYFLSHPTAGETFDNNLEG